MYVLKNEVMELYVAMIRSDVALAQSIGNRTEANANDRNAFVFAYSMPFWATMPAVLDDAGFYSLLDFTEHMDQIIAPDSLFERLCNTYKFALQNAIKKDVCNARKQ